MTTQAVKFDLSNVSDAVKEIIVPSNPLLVPDLARAIREAGTGGYVNEVSADEEPPQDETESTDTPVDSDNSSDVSEELSDEMRRVPNRKILRDLLHQRGEEQALRSRVRRGVYRQRRKFDRR